jgi:hypothetical protein
MIRPFFMCERQDFRAQLPSKHFPALFRIAQPQVVVQWSGVPLIIIEG